MTLTYRAKNATIEIGGRSFPVGTVEIAPDGLRADIGDCEARFGAIEIRGELLPTEEFDLLWREIYYRRVATAFEPVLPAAAYWLRLAADRLRSRRKRSILPAVV